jgi:hypothetical protein
MRNEQTQFPNVNHQKLVKEKREAERKREDKKMAGKYRKMALRQVRTLASSEYLASEGNGNFLLRHSVGNKPGGGEVDVPLTYADYYFLEALLRLTR